MEKNVFGIIAILAGSFFFIRNVILLTDESKIPNYLETSPKAKMWVKKFGIEKTIKLSKSIFIPLGCIVSLVLIGTGIYSLIK